MKQSVRLDCLFILLIIGTTACNAASQHRAENSVAKAGSSQGQSKKPGVPSPMGVTSGVTYTIINTDIVPGIKRCLDVRLSRKVDADVLRSIATDLKESDANQYEKTLIAYYLPDMQVGAGGWATTNFSPDLQVNILGLSADEERVLTEERSDTTYDVIGNWLDQSPVVGGKISIYRLGGKLLMERKFKDGSNSIEEIVETTTSKGNRYEKTGGSRFETHYIIDRQGNLQIRDQEGLIATARKID